MLNFIQAYFTLTFGAREDDERGASAVEYGLLVAGIAAVIVAVVFVLGDYIGGAFNNTCDEFTGNVSGVTTSCP